MCPSHKTVSTVNAIALATWVEGMIYSYYCLFIYKRYKHAAPEKSENPDSLYAFSLKHIPSP